MVMPAATLVLIAVGYWVLAVAAKRGNPSSVASVVVVMVLQFFLAVVAYGITTARTGENVQANVPGLVIPMLVVIALASSRNVLLELRKRDLWEPIFGSAKPSSRLCVAGTILIVIGFIGLNGSTIYAGWNSGRSRQLEVHQAQGFADMIQSEEQAFMNAMGGLSDPYSAEEIQAVLATVKKLQRRADAAMADAKEGSPLRSILEDYCNAVRQWKNAVTLLASETPDGGRAQEMLLLGDKLRTQAGQNFDSRYIPQQ